MRSDARDYLTRAADSVLLFNATPCNFLAIRLGAESSAWKSAPYGTPLEILRLTDASAFPLFPYTLPEASCICPVCLQIISAPA